MGRTLGCMQDLGAKPFRSLAALARARPQDQPDQLQAALDHYPVITNHGPLEAYEGSPAR